MSTHQIYRNARPSLTVTFVSSSNRGRYYDVARYLVTSTKPLDRQTLIGMYRLDLLGMGQEFRILGQERADKTLDKDLPEKKTWEYKPTPTSYDEVPLVEVDDRTNDVVRVIEGKANRQGVYVYHVETGCDSGD